MLITIFSQIPAPAADQLRDWLLCATAVLAAGALARQFMRKPPIEAEFINKTEFAEFRRKLDRDLDALWGKLDRTFGEFTRRLEEIHRADEQGIAALHARINEVRSLVDRVDERTRPAKRCL